MLRKKEMTSPFLHIDKAFAPFFTEKISVKTNDGKRTSVLNVSVFTDGTSDPLTTDMMETEREDMTFVFNKKDWPFVKELQRGATIRRMMNSKEYSVSEAKFDEALGWIVTAREM